MLCAQNVETSNGCIPNDDQGVSCVLRGGAGRGCRPPFRRVATRADKCCDTIALMCSAIIDTDTRKRNFYHSI